MTMWGKFFRPPMPLVAAEERWPTPDGDELSLVRTGGAPGAPVLVVLHGLEGSVHSHYANAVLAESARRGWNGLLMHFRTCDGRMNRTRRTYHSGETGDLGLVVERLLALEPGAVIGLVGYSLGANVLLKWLGELGDRVPSAVAGAVAVSTPFDLARSSRRINAGFSRVYQWNFVRKLRRKALAKLREHPDVAPADTVAAARTFWEFDDRFTAPLHGFRDARDYYARNSSLPWLVRIRRRTLLLSARDDPFHPPAVLRDVEAVAGGNPWLELEFHARGGHVGFVAGSPWAPRYYLEHRVLDYLGALTAAA